MKPKYEIVKDGGRWYVMKGARIAHDFATRAEAERWVRMLTGGAH